MAAINDYIDWYNSERIQVKLKGMSPLQFRKHAFKIAL
ncbi:MAG: IS3 family transposase [Spirochaetales bacterium]|nr:IS3 family transposase [Spirochaetales bacterium]MBR1582781.1 IS3 family transposase [Spirochaetales bacterium]